MNISAIILAGGKSTRMKYNKEFIKIKDEFLVHKQIKALERVFDEIIVVSNNPEHYKDFNVTVVSDIISGNTPIIGLHAGLYHSSNEYNYCIACDMPYINFDFIVHLISLIDNHDAYVAKYNGYIEPFNAIYSRKIIGIIEEFISSGNYGFQRMVKLIDTLYISEQVASFYQQDNDMFKNINDESELFDDFLDFTSNYQIFEIDKVIDNDTFKVKDKVITEYPLNLYINKNHYATLMTTPENIEFLVVGFLHSDFVIKEISDIIDFSLDMENHRCDVSINHEINTNNSQRLNILSSACGNSKSSGIDPVLLPSIPITRKFILSDIFNEVASFNKESVLFKETGGVHSVQLVYGDERILFEDIGRHNAVDKVVGYLLKNNIQRDDCYLITSGRISSDILLKSALMNISLIVSRSAPTSLAVKLAELIGITIIGFARGNKLNIYSEPSRIIRSE